MEFMVQSLMAFLLFANADALDLLNHILAAVGLALSVSFEQDLAET